MQKDSLLQDKGEEQAGHLLEHCANAAAATKMVAAAALRGILKSVKVAAAQRVAMLLRAQQRSLVGGHLDG